MFDTIPRDDNSIPFYDWPIYVPLGLVPNVSGLNKFGRAPSGIQTTAVIQ